MSSDKSSVNLSQLFNDLHRFEQSSDFDKALKITEKSNLIKLKTDSFDDMINCFVECI